MESSHVLLPFPLICPDPFPPPLTVLSKPRVMSMRKKMMAKNVAAGMLAIASAYVMKRRLGPEREGERRTMRTRRRKPLRPIPPSDGELEPGYPSSL